MPKLTTIAAGISSTYGYVPSGTLITNTLDLGDVPDGGPAPTYALDVTTPTGTTVSVVASRSSNDGVTWSDWSASDGLTLTSPVARYWQLKLALATIDQRQTPTLVSVTISGSGTIEPNWEWDGGGRWNAL